MVCLVSPSDHQSLPPPLGQACCGSTIRKVLPQHYLCPIVPASLVFWLHITLLCTVFNPCINLSVRSDNVNRKSGFRLVCNLSLFLTYPALPLLICGSSVVHTILCARYMSCQQTWITAAKVHLDFIFLNPKVHQIRTIFVVRNPRKLVNIMHCWTAIWHSQVELDVLMRTFTLPRAVCFCAQRKRLLGVSEVVVTILWCAWIRCPNLARRWRQSQFRSVPQCGQCKHPRTTLHAPFSGKNIQILILFSAQYNIDVIIWFKNDLCFINWWVSCTLLKCKICAFIRSSTYYSNTAVCT